MTDPSELLAGLDQPRPLSVELRSHLEAQLLADPAARALDPALASRLNAALTDPVRDLLHDLDAPRGLPAGLRAQLVGELARRPRRAWAVAAAVAGVAAAALVPGVVLQPAAPRPPSSAVGTPAIPSPTPSDVLGLTGGGTSSTGVASVPGSAPFQPVATASTAPPGVGTALGGSVLSAPAAAPALVAPPTLSPDAGPLAGGTRVLVQHAGDARQVRFGSVPGTRLRRESGDAVSVLTPAVRSPADLPVTLVLADGAQLPASMRFSYLAEPHLQQLSPAAGRAGSWITLQGTALTRATTVTFAGTASTKVEVRSDNELRVLAPPHSAGSVDVVATSPGGRSNSVSFVYLP